MNVGCQRKKKTNKDQRPALFYALSFQLMYVHDKLLMTTRSRHLDILIKKMSKNYGAGDGYVSIPLLPKFLKDILAR